MWIDGGPRRRALRLHSNPALGATSDIAGLLPATRIRGHFELRPTHLLALTVPFKHFHPCDSLHLRLRCVMKKCMPIANSVAPPVD
jgi:hypothetical protein